MAAAANGPENEIFVIYYETWNDFLEQITNYLVRPRQTPLPNSPSFLSQEAEEYIVKNIFFMQGCWTSSRSSLLAPPTCSTRWIRRPTFLNLGQKWVEVEFIWWVHQQALHPRHCRLFTFCKINKIISLAFSFLPWTLLQQHINANHAHPEDNRKRR